MVFISPFHVRFNSTLYKKSEKNAQDLADPAEPWFLKLLQYHLSAEIFTPHDTSLAHR